jgi:hypothetical protein
MPRNVKKISVFIVPLFLSLFAIQGKATTAIMLSDSELAVSSRLIVTGEIRSVVSAWDDTHTYAWTYIEVSCERVLKGEVGNQTIVVKQLGGDFADSGLHVFGQPKFAQGQKVLLYLNTAPDGSLRIAHNFMGKFSIESDAATGQLLATRSLLESEVQLLKFHDSADITQRAPLKSHIQNIRKFLREQPERVAQYDAINQSVALLPVPVEYNRVKSGAGNISPQFEVTGGGVRWMEADSGQAINFYLNSTNSPVSSGGATEITSGMNAWSAQSGANIRLQIAGQTASCGSQGDGSNVISFADCLSQLQPPVGCSGVLAQTTVRYTSETRVVGGRTFRRLVESDIVFNRGMNCFLGNSNNLAEVACHELGHAIGLDHSADTAAIMWASARGNRGAVLGDDDKAGVLAIYPSTGGTGGGTGGGGTTTIDEAAFITQSVPTTMTAGQTYSASVTMRNRGNTTWSNSYKLRSENPTGNSIWGVSTLNVPFSIVPLLDATFLFTVTAPTTPGTYNFQWRMTKDGTGGFGSVSSNITITVEASGGTGGGGPVKITSLTMANGVVGSTYKQVLTAAGGRAPYTWQIINGNLPPGLTLTQSGTIEGVPSRAGAYPVGLQVFDVTANPTVSDTLRVTLTINDQSGGGGGLPPNTPVISRVKIKGEKKLFVIGQNFSSQSFIILNGQFLEPTSYEFDNGVGTLFYKGRLTLNETGANTVKVINGSTISGIYIF